MFATLIMENFRPVCGTVLFNGALIGCLAGSVLLVLPPVRQTLGSRTVPMFARLLSGAGIAASAGLLAVLILYR